MPGPNRTAAGPPGHSGFTLIEVLVVVAIVAVLFSIAVPSYQGYVQRGHRAEAIRAMLEVTACQERVRAAGGYYDTTRCTPAEGAGKYRLRLEPPGQAELLEYAIVASPVIRRSDDRCGDLHLDHAGTRAIGGEPRHASACWGGR
jgi:type IV pilus assembly protein PilE